MKEEKKIDRNISPRGLNMALIVGVSLL